MAQVESHQPGQLIVSWQDAYDRGNNLQYFPRELRDQIYESAIPIKRPIPVNAHGVLSLPGIWLSSRQLREEKVPIFLKHTTIRINFPVPSSQIFTFFGSTHLNNKSTDEIALSWLLNILPEDGAVKHIRSLNIGSLVSFGTHPYTSLAPGTMCRRYLPGRELASRCTNLTHLTITCLDCKTFDGFVDKNGLKTLLGFKKLKSIRVIVRFSDRFHLDREKSKLLRNGEYDKFSDEALLNWFVAEYAKLGQKIEGSTEWNRDIYYVGIIGCLRRGEGPGTESSLVNATRCLSA